MKEYVEMMEAFLKESDTTVETVCPYYWRRVTYVPVSNCFICLKFIGERYTGICPCGAFGVTEARKKAQAAVERYRRKEKYAEMMERFLKDSPGGLIKGRCPQFWAQVYGSRPYYPCKECVSFIGLRDEYSCPCNAVGPERARELTIAAIKKFKETGE